MNEEFIALSRQLTSLSETISAELKIIRQDIRTDNQLVRTDIKELHNKIDHNKDVSNEQFTDLMANGCAQGQLDRKDIMLISKELNSFKEAPDKTLGRLSMIISIGATLIAVITALAKVS